MPILGPPNWDQIWYDWDDFGHDYEEPVEPNSPLPADQLKQVYWYANKHGKVKDVRFIRRLGQGNNASVWMVYGMFGEPVQLACKVLKPPSKDLQEGECMIRIIGIQGCLIWNVPGEGIRGESSEGVRGGFSTFNDL